MEVALRQWLSSTPQSKRLNLIVWILAIILALIFLMASIPKLLGTQAEKDAFERWGYTEGFMYVVGAGEFLAAIFLLIPRVRFWGAAGLVVDMIGAIATHINVGEYAALPMPIGPLVLAAILAWIDRPPVMRFEQRAKEKAEARV